MSDSNTTPVARRTLTDSIARAGRVLQSIRGGLARTKVDEVVRISQGCCLPIGRVAIRVRCLLNIGRIQSRLLRVVVTGIGSITGVSSICSIAVAGIVASVVITVLAVTVVATVAIATLRTGSSNVQHCNGKEQGQDVGEVHGGMWLQERIAW